MKRNQRYDPDRVHELEQVARYFLKDNGVRASANDYSDDWYCEYCEAEVGGTWPVPVPFPHEPDCPVLLAQDLLTGIEETEA